jgi:hypothetical protein
VRGSQVFRLHGLRWKWITFRVSVLVLALMAWNEEFVDAPRANFDSGGTPRLLNGQLEIVVFLVADYS